MKDFQDRFAARVSERDPSGEASRAIEQAKREVGSADASARSEMKALMAEARRLKDTGDINSDPAKQIVQRLRSLCGKAAGKAALPLKAHEDAIRYAFNATIADAQARSEGLPFDPIALDFIIKVAKGMKERGELT
jgi:hypothetical protein